LLRSNVFYDINNLCANRDEQNCFGHFKPTAALVDLGKIMSNEWASDTQRRIELEDDFDPDVDFFLPLQLYGNKTGTDVNQCYPLEPWMFTFALLQRKAREDLKNWRHLGFLPSQDFAPSKKGSLSPEKKLQQYHDYMLVLLEEVKTASEVRPKMWVNLGGTWRKMRCFQSFLVTRSCKTTSAVGRQATMGQLAVSTVDTWPWPSMPLQWGLVEFFMEGARSCRLKC
jgi:hypothetical protein